MRSACSLRLGTKILSSPPMRSQLEHSQIDPDLIVLRSRAGRTNEGALVDVETMAALDPPEIRVRNLICHVGARRADLEDISVAVA
jgi:hypothetical protein